jgi:hypothetical protein
MNGQDFFSNKCLIAFSMFVIVKEKNFVSSMFTQYVVHFIEIFSMTLRSFNFDNFGLLNITLNIWKFRPWGAKTNKENV